MSGLFENSPVVPVEGKFMEELTKVMLARRNRSFTELRKHPFLKIECNFFCLQLLGLSAFWTDTPFCMIQKELQKSEPEYLNKLVFQVEYDISRSSHESFGTKKDISFLCYTIFFKKTQFFKKVSLCTFFLYAWRRLGTFTACFIIWLCRNTDIVCREALILCGVISFL